MKSINATRENLFGDQKKYPKEINKIRNVGYPNSVIVSKKKDKYGVLMDSTQLKSFHNDIYPLITILRLFTRFRR